MNQEISEAARLTVIEMWGEAGKQTQIKVSGDSMKPVLDQSCLLILSHIGEYKIGDIIVFQKNGDMIAHRIVRILSSELFLTKGDGRLDLDPAVRKNEIIGRVVAVKKGNKTISYEKRKWEFINRFLAKYSYATFRVFDFLRKIRFRILGRQKNDFTDLLSKVYRRAASAFSSIFLRLIG